MARPVLLNWRLFLEERQRVSDGAGGFSETWVQLGQLWGEIQTRSVQATEVSAGGTSLERHRILVRGAAEGDPRRPLTGQRFRNGSKAYTIDSVSENDASGMYLLCWTREEVLT